MSKLPQLDTPTKGILVFTDSTGVRTSIEDLWTFVRVGFDSSTHAIGEYHTVTDIDVKNPEWTAINTVPESVVYASLSVPASDLKMLRETLCASQARLNTSESRKRIGRVINEIDRHRPLGPDGKHGILHTLTCGCDLDE